MGISYADFHTSFAYLCQGDNPQILRFRVLMISRTCAALAKSLVSFGETIPFVFDVSGLKGRVPGRFAKTALPGETEGKKLRKGGGKPLKSLARIILCVGARSSATAPALHPWIASPGP